MTDWKALYKDLRMINWIILLAVSLASYLFASEERTVGVVAGGFIISANFSLFQHTLSRAFSPGGTMKRGKASIIAKYYLRLSALGVILYVLITKKLVDPIGLTIGLSTMFFSITVLGITRAFRQAKGEAL